MAMAGLGGMSPNFEGLLDGDQPKDTEVTIVEEDSPTANSSKKRSRQGAEDNHITIQAHWVVLRSLSPYFLTKVTTESLPMGLLWPVTLSGKMQHTSTRSATAFSKSMSLKPTPCHSL
jgi:hypothetical protein